jgi:hypothetical protein
MTTDEELKKIWQALDTRITTINDRTKAHTLEMKRLEKELKTLGELVNNGYTHQKNYAEDTARVEDNKENAGG